MSDSATDSGPSTNPKKSSELLKRIGVAVVGAPTLLWVFWMGDAVLATVLAAMAALSAFEFMRIARAGGAHPMSAVGIVLAALIPIAVHAQLLHVVNIPNVAAVLVMLAVVAASIWMRGVTGKPLGSAAITLFGAAYTGGTLSFAYALRYFGYAVGDVPGALVLILPVALTWASDTGAYFAGRAFKGPKLIPSVSPAKTISGAVGGMVLTVIVCMLYVRYSLRPYAQLGFTPWGVVLFAVAISISAQLGDLVESLYKREAGVKDSGTLLPGHGGALDRFDSLFFVLPVAYAMYWLLLIPAPAP
ncbi:MAG: phosphatidate cytidylyltransferase [Gemmatimonadota bacterium]|nr:phosphatidate cytidylyltransferase [Gemmatimonadota bacterium]